MVGVADLTAGSVYLSTRLGVDPAYGGKHPSGTHNTLLSLGLGTYLELIAPQPGAAPTAFLSRLSALSHPKPIAWAVSGEDLALLRQRLTQAGFHLTNPEPGSRKTPNGTTLRWQTFALSPEIPGAPFFIVWSKSSYHPSTTSPSGCSLGRLSVSSPDAQALTRLAAALGLALDIVAAETFGMTLTLKCPAGEVTLTNP
ncbi:MAG: VOC family protein [Thermoanaerobaculia bacterium]